jgi:GxxExxY protein
MQLNDITGQIVDAAMRVHEALGPGLLESAYQACLAHELRKRSLGIVVQHPLPIVYDGFTFDIGYRMDFVVENKVVVELKAVTEVVPVHKAQLLSYLKLGKYPVGLLINFHSYFLKDGITRMINTS